MVEFYQRSVKKIDFYSGLNIIIDDTPAEDTKSTGNNVGKTTVLKLIDFCLGAKGSIIYTDTKNKKETYDVVKNFLCDEEIEIKLILTEDLNDSNAKQLEIQRNFLQRKKAVRKINGKTVLDKDFEDELEKNIVCFEREKYEADLNILFKKVELTEDGTASQRVKKIIDEHMGVS